MDTDNKELLSEFLNIPLDSGNEIYNKFKSLPEAISNEGEKPLQRYVYIPGAREDRVVLVAHMDTVWDRAYEKEIAGEHSVTFANGIFSSASDQCGIGADDRAGCAMLWKLQDCGHSLLLVDGEEHGKIGARYLRKSNRALFKELNKHCFMIELDHIRTNHVSFKQVENSGSFKGFFQEGTGFKDYNVDGGCDLQILCKNICGANVGVGYRYYHTSKEELNLAEWENTYNKLKKFLAQPQKRYKIALRKRFVQFIKRCFNKGLRILKIKK